MAIDRGSAAPVEHDRRRLRSARRLVLVGAGLGALTAAGFGFAGGSGALGLVLLLLGLMIGCVGAAAHLAAFALIDEFKRRPVGARRGIEAVGFFLLALLLMLLVMGAAATLSAAPTSSVEAAAHREPGPDTGIRVRDLVASTPSSVRPWGGATFPPGFS